MKAHDHHSKVESPQGTDGPPRVLKIAAWIMFGVGGAYYLWTQHRAHVFQYWPLAIFLLCPFMHFFGGHGNHSSPDKPEDHKNGGGHP